MPQITLPGYQERLLFIGSNGTGKTQAARRFLRDYPRVVVIDLKGRFQAPWPDAKVLKKPPIDFASRSDWETHDHIIYRPKPEYQSGDWPAFILEYLFRRAERIGKTRPFILYVDEGLFLAQTGAKTWLKIIAITGREMGIGLWLSSQRPKGIPVEVRSEAWKWYIFYLPYEEDDKEVIAYSKRQLTLHMLNEGFQPYGFYEMTLERGGKVTVRKFPPIKLD